MRYTWSMHHAQLEMPEEYRGKPPEYFRDPDIDIDEIAKEEEDDGEKELDQEGA